MEKEDFQIDGEFYTQTGKWRCTDIGSRVIVAVKIRDRSGVCLRDQAGAEFVFDEYDFGGCDLVDRFNELPGQKQSGFKKLIPCSRCGSTDRAKLGVIVSMEMETHKKIRVCEDCKTETDKSCIKFGRFKWICECGANIWHDDSETNNSCFKCGNTRETWVRIHE